ncbi:MAG: alpha/beta fold hydrolase [Rubrivivax sp.]|nr:alpha/beta fold hydrolase [Rubrivivax sp.]
MLRSLWSVPLALALVYALLLALLWVAQEKLIFMPAKLPADHRFDFGADVHEVWIDRGSTGTHPDAARNTDPVRLHALHLRLPAPDGVVFYLHGNAGNLDSWFTNAAFWRQANLDLFMLDYRGYGKSGGRVQSEAQLVDDVRAAWQQVAPQYAGKRRIVFGRSLGSALAAKLSAEVKPDLTLLVSPYESLVALAAEHYAWVPRALLRYPLRTDEAVARLANPLVIVHGERDEIIALHHAQRLLAHAAPAAQARLVRVSGAGHNDLQLFPQYLQGLRDAFASLPAK